MAGGNLEIFRACLSSLLSPCSFQSSMCPTRWRTMQRRHGLWKPIRYVETWYSILRQKFQGPKNCQILFRQQWKNPSIFLKIKFSCEFLAVGEFSSSYKRAVLCFTTGTVSKSRVYGLFVAQAHKNVSSTNSEDSKWSQKFILLLSRAVTLILARQLDPSPQKHKYISTFWKCPSEYLLKYLRLPSFMPSSLQNSNTKYTVFKQFYLFGSSHHSLWFDKSVRST